MSIQDTSYGDLRAQKIFQIFHSEKILLYRKPYRKVTYFPQDVKISLIFLEKGPVISCSSL